MRLLDGRQMLCHGAFAVIIGIVGALTSVVLCLVVGFAAGLSGRHGWLLYLLPLLGIASLALYRLFKLPLDTTTHTVARDIRDNQHISPLLAPGILIGTALSILGGASVGKEAGALHMGASLGDLLARPFRLRPIYRRDQRAGVGHEGMRTFAAATGMAATFAALFFAPLGAATFVIELTRYKREVIKHLPTMLLACFTAFALASLIGIGDIIPKVPLPSITWHLVGECVIIGVACALVGTVYIKAIDCLQQATKRAPGGYFLWLAVGGVAFIVLVNLFGWQDFEGTGANQLALALKGEQEIWGFAVKALLSIICLGMWFRGGEIMPTFTVGALLGASCTVMTGGGAGYSAAIGIVAFFAAMSRCPLAAFLMGCEIFGWAGAPLFAPAVFIAFALGDDVGYYGRGGISVVHEAVARRRALHRREAESIVAHGLDAVIERGRDGIVEVEDALEQHGMGAGSVPATEQPAAPLAPTTDRVVQEQFVPTTDGVLQASSVPTTDGVVQTSPAAPPSAAKPPAPPAAESPVLSEAAPPPAVEPPSAVPPAAEPQASARPVPEIDQDGNVKMP